MGIYSRAVRARAHTERRDKRQVKKIGAVAAVQITDSKHFDLSNTAES